MGHLRRGSEQAVPAARAGHGPDPVPGPLPDRGGALPFGAAGSLSAAATRLVQRLLDVGIDGVGPFASAHDVADAALVDAGGQVEKAVAGVRRTHQRMAAAGGFVTGLGGFFAMPVSLPANVLTFYLIGTRMTAAVARLRGYDIDQPEIRSAILLTLVGADRDDILRKAGLHPPGGRLAALAVDQLSPPALMVLNKAVGFHLLGKLGDGVLAGLGRGVPLLGGAVGGGMDVYLVGRIARQAGLEFPPVSPFSA
ncbi:hypothetical protein [Intrasporangium sp.]|uniref:hypothetical protein n=1 Tax=Intrasporangium sp. TaxID=1925024 RepID=UPI0032216A46